MPPHKKPFHGFGLLVEGIIATVQAIALGSATAIQHDRVRKEHKKRSSLLDLLHQQRLADIQGAGVQREEAIKLKAEAALYEEKSTKLAASLGVGVAMLGALVLVYFLYKGGPDE